MNRIKMIFLLAAVLGILASGTALAVPQVSTLSWWTMDGGGGTSANGVYRVQGTIGQAEAGTMQGGEDGLGYSLVGGFWAGAITAQDDDTYQVWMPLMVR